MGVRRWPAPFVHAVTLAGAIAVAACSAPPERTLIADFFAASRLRDLTALSRFATVVFEPAQAGTVTRFEIQNISAERIEGQDRLKEVTIGADVVSPRGDRTRKLLRLTMRRRPASEGELYGGWKVIGVSEGGETIAPPLA